MSTTLEAMAERCLVRLEGEIDINCSDELKRLLAEALSMRHPLDVDMAGASDCDITAIQLLWAAARDAADLGIAFTISEAVPDRIRAAALEVGLAKLFGSSASGD